MFGRHTKTFRNLYRAVHAIKRNPKDLDLLVRTQKLIASKIKQTERRIRTLRENQRLAKRELRQPRESKELSAKLRHQIERATSQIQDAQTLLMFWRYFGDAIAFIYLDKYALKHAFFRTDVYEPKEAAGHLSGKQGLKLEWKLVSGLAKRGIPAMLCDITNTVRHGDVCILVGPDPYLIEVKTGTSSNPRIERQIKSLESLAQFYENDFLEDFRQSGRVGRASFDTPEVGYGQEMTDLIERTRATTTQNGICTPEPGLTYGCLRSPALSPELIPGDATGSFFTPLNRTKNAGWMPYYPFVLTISKEDAFIEFMVGDVVLFVGIHTPTLIELFEAKGVHAEILDDDAWMIRLTRSEDLGGASAVSIALFLRLFLEFQSLSWFVSASEELSNKVMSDIAKRAAELGELPKDHPANAEHERIGKLKPLKIDRH